MLFPLTWPLMWPTSLLTSAVGSPKSSETFASNSSVPHGKGLRSTDVHGSRRQTRRTDLWAIHVWKQPNQAFTDGNKLLTVRGQANCNGLQPTSDGLQPKRERERERSPCSSLGANPRSWRSPRVADQPQTCTHDALACAPAVPIKASCFVIVIVVITI